MRDAPSAHRPHGVLAWMARGLVLTGAKALSWTLGDRDAIKRILEHTFGPAGKPSVTEGHNSPAQHREASVAKSID